LLPVVLPAGLDLAGHRGGVAVGRDVSRPVRHDLVAHRPNPPDAAAHSALRCAPRLMPPTLTSSLSAFSVCTEHSAGMKKPLAQEGPPCRRVYRVSTAHQEGGTPVSCGQCTAFSIYPGQGVYGAGTASTVSWVSTGTPFWQVIWMRTIDVALLKTTP